jgi:hypothetical protein
MNDITEGLLIVVLVLATIFFIAMLSGISCNAGYLSQSSTKVTPKPLLEMNEQKPQQALTMSCPRC